MEIGYPAREAVLQGDERRVASIGEVLRLLSGGATGAILLALGEGPMQTKVLTHQVRGYTARTIYRYLPKLARLRVVERDDRPDGPAKVVNTLTPESGNDLCAVVDRFARASMTRLPGGQVEPGTWGSLSLLADLWDAGVVDELSRGSRSPTELVQNQRGLSYHQLNRRAGQFRAAGFLRDTERSRSRQRCYALSDKARRTMGLVAGVGRWRQRHLTAPGETGLTAEELATVLRATLPLAAIPQHALKTMRIHIWTDGEHAEVWAEVDEEGRPRTDRPSAPRCEAEVEGDIETWLAALLDGKQVEGEGEVALIRDCLAALYEALWTPRPF